MINFSYVPQVWASYVCQVSVNGICTTTGRLTPSFYSQMGNGVSMSIALYNNGPFLLELQDCTFARETFSQIYTKHCPALQRYSKWIYIGLAMVSTAVMLSLIFWVIYGRERRHRLYAKQSMADGRSGQDLELEKDQSLGKKIDVYSFRLILPAVLIALCILFVIYQCCGVFFFLGEFLRTRRILVTIYDKQNWLLIKN